MRDRCTDFLMNQILFSIAYLSTGQNEAPRNLTVEICLGRIFPSGNVTPVIAHTST